MPPPESHTIVRISLRSMLAITLGVAVVMAAGRPYIKSLDLKLQQHLFQTAAIMGLGMVLTTTYITWKRQWIGKKCGPLLLTVTSRGERHRKWLRWLWLLILVPLTVIHFSNSGHQMQSSRGATFSLLLPAIYSIFLTQGLLAFWSEGYGNNLELCEQGLVFGSRFYAWSASNRPKMDWHQNPGKLAISFPYTLVSTKFRIPPAQREGVEAILQHYYRAATGATDRA